ncbi:MAG TPA: SDR family oxidoreductase [Amycolatopsis sp.]|nr:SDR family oxidoreductase [Amycolatopsis sp.]
MFSVLAGKVAVVVGASSGIGEATMALLAEHETNVVGMARNADRLEKAVAAIGRNTCGVPCDATDPDQVRSAFRTVRERFGRVDMLFNVLGAARATTIADATDEDISTVIGTNLLAPVYTTRSAVPLLQAAGGGDIVNVSSEVTIDLFPYLTLYGTAKAGLEMFTKAMTKELKAAGIRVTLFVSGRTKTNFSMPMTPQRRAEAQAAWDADGCMRRVAGATQMRPEEVAESMVFAVTRPRGQMIDVVQVRSFS